jgi:hypothetical protein
MPDLLMCKLLNYRHLPNPLQLQPSRSRHLQVEHHATGDFRTVAFKEFFRRTEGFDSLICSPEKAGQSAEKRQVVIHQIDDRRPLMLALGLGRGDGFVGHADFFSSAISTYDEKPSGGSGHDWHCLCQPSAAYRSGIFRPKVQ